MKKIVCLSFILILVTAFTGCESTNNNVFEATNFVSTNVQNVQTLALDFEGDNIDENAVWYEEADAKTDQLEVYKLVNNKWEKVFNKSFSHLKADPRNTMGDLWIFNVEAADVSNDNKDELFVKVSISDKQNSDNYFIVTLKNGSIQEIDTPKGSKAVEINFYGKMLTVTVDKDGIKEHWGGTCEGGTNPCYYFDFLITPETASSDKWIISNASNIQKDEQEYKKYTDAYPDAQAWTDTLSF